MQNQNTPAHDPQTLEAVAEILLWLGFDRAADAIYADLEAQEWDEVFQG